MNKTFLFFIFFGFISLLQPQNTALASNINYGSVVETSADQILVSYDNTEELNKYSCTYDGKCSKTKNSILPALSDTHPYTYSTHGNVGVVSQFLPAVNQTFYIIYRNVNNEITFEGIIPYYKNNTEISFSRDENTIILHDQNNSVALYDRKDSSLNTLNPINRPNLSFSPNAQLVSAYNAVTKEHVITDLNSQSQFVIPSQESSIVEFSSNGSLITFIDNKNGSPTLFLYDRETNTTNQITENQTVTDYIFVDNTLFFVANDKDNPYSWNLYMHDTRENKTKIVASDASYSNLMKPLGDKVLFSRILGGARVPTIYDTQTKDVIDLTPFEVNDPFESIDRSIIENDGTYSVLWEPDNKRSKILVIWLHGGPKRQTSYGYHPYKSYGVYDDILVKMIDKGVSVLKVDYRGSYGYGDAFMNDLNASIGSRDVQDVYNAYREVSRGQNFKEVYTMGNSYGGYLALKSMTAHPDIFDGAISINGVTDWDSLISRIPSSPFASYFGGIPSSGNDRLYKEASILNNLDKLDSHNILLAYGELDSSVPTWQTRDMYAALKSTNTDTDLLVFTDEGHVIENKKNLRSLCKSVGSTIGENLSCN